MELEHTPQEQDFTPEPKQSVWNTVTPFSKYLAMAHFVILPFIGGYIGYTFAPEKIVEIEKEVIREVEVERVVEEPVFNEDFVLKGNLFKDFEMTRTVDGEYLMSWSVVDDVRSTFAELDTAYVTFSLVPVGAKIDYKNNNGVSQNIGDGFSLNKSKYTFDPSYYDKKFSWQLNWGAAYQIVGRLKYQPAEFGCNPLYPDECSPAYSADDGQLVQKALKYIFVSEPFILE